MTEDQSIKLTELLKKELKARFKNISNSKTGKKLTPEEKKELLINELNKISDIKSIINFDADPPSRVEDFKVRPFHSKMSLFD